MTERLTLTVNGVEVHVEAMPHHTLLHILREQLNLGSVREGCGVGLCGSCTVLVDEKPLTACLMFAFQASGRTILTVEGLERQGELDPVQASYLECGGFQCSFCTPGFILATKALLSEQPNAGPEEIRDYLGGQLCRCGSYVKVLDSVMLAQRRTAHK